MVAKQPALVSDIMPTIHIYRAGEISMAKAKTAVKKTVKKSTSKGAMKGSCGSKKSCK
jgi:hypothetical protein